MRKIEILMLDLQLLAEGDGGTAQGQGVTAAAALPQTKGEKSNPLAQVKYGIQEESAPAAEVQQVETPDRSAVFEQMIKGEYKDLYDANVQKIVQNRLKGSKETVEKYTALTPVLEILGRKYGVDATDSVALAKAIENDDTLLEEEALKRGMTTEQYKDFRRIEQDNAELRRQIEAEKARKNEEAANQIYAAWMQQAEQMRSVYPSFDMRTEMSNPTFVSLLKSNIDVRTAYEVVHKDEIMPAAMSFTAKKVEEQISKSIASGAARPVENGMQSQSAAVVKSDVSQLSKDDRAEIIRRVARGEKIRF